MTKLTVNETIACVHDVGETNIDELISDLQKIRQSMSDNEVANHCLKFDACMDDCDGEVYSVNLNVVVSRLETDREYEFRKRSEQKRLNDEKQRIVQNIEFLEKRLKDLEDA